MEQLAPKTHEEFIKHAQQIGALAEAEVNDSEQNAGFSEAFPQLIRAGHLNRLLRPRQYGGYGMGPRTFAEVIRTVARHSSAAAWLTYFIPLHEQWVSFLHPEARQEIFASDGFIADIFSPIGRIEYVEGGVRISGQWNWGSGILFCEWVGLGAIVDVPGHGGPQPCLVTVNKSQFEVIRNWASFGLRGTGSHAVKVENVFVPWKMILPVISAKKTLTPVGGDYDPTEPIYRQPFMPSFLLGFIAIALGGAERITEELINRTHKRERVIFGAKEWESPVSQRNIAEIDAKRLSIERAYNSYIGRLEECVASGQAILSEREENQMGVTRATAVREASELALRAFELLAGAAAYQGDPIERFARDLFMVRIHIAQIYEDHLVAYGRTIYGLSGHPLG